MKSVGKLAGYTADIIAHHGILDDEIKFINKTFSRAETIRKARHRSPTLPTRSQTCRSPLTKSRIIMHNAEKQNPCLKDRRMTRIKLTNIWKAIEDIPGEAGSRQALFEEGQPLFMSRVQAGFPSPAEDYVEGRLDLNKHLVKHPAATFFVRVAGESMINAGIHPNDILVVDRSLEATDKRVVIAVINGELTVKRLRIQNGAVCLMAENPDYPPIEVTASMEFEIWGVVVHVIHTL